MNKIVLLNLAFLLSACSVSQSPPIPAAQLLTPTVANSSTSAGILTLSSSQLAGMNLSGRLVLIQYNPGGNTLIELNLPGGETRTLFQSPEKSWLAAAAVSPDGERILLSYAPPPASGQVQLGTTDLYWLPSDGSTPPRPLIERSNPKESYFNPTWSADGHTLLFSAVNPQPKPSGSWLDRLLGITIASAHNVPSDWYLLALPGGEPQRLTRLNDTGMFADVSPGGDRVIFISATGLYTMKLDGSNLVQISPRLFIGTVDWIE